MGSPEHVQLYGCKHCRFIKSIDISLHGALHDHCIDDNYYATQMQINCFRIADILMSRSVIFISCKIAVAVVSNSSGQNEGALYGYSK